MEEKRSRDVQGVRWFVLKKPRGDTNATGEDEVTVTSGLQVHSLSWLASYSNSIWLQHFLHNSIVLDGAYAGAKVDFLSCWFPFLLFSGRVVLTEQPA